MRNEPNTTTPNTTGPQLLHRHYQTKAQFARRWGVSVRCIENWMRQRRFPHIKIGRSVRIDPIAADLALKRLERKEVD